MIPEEIKKKIVFKANQLFNHSESDQDDTQQLLLRVYPDAAEFGYSLSLTEIEGLKKENERVSGLLKKLYYAGFGGILISLDYDENLRQTEIDKHWQSFAKANNIKL